jgi:hypothetical protein
MNFLWPVLSLLIAINDVHVSIHIKYYYVFNIDKKKNFHKTTLLDNSLQNENTIKT